MTLDATAAADHIALALDVATLDEAQELARDAAPGVGVIKVGLELFVRFGEEATRIASDVDRRLFLDLKLHDIPETVERAVEGVARLGARYLTVHASGGPEMLRRAARAAEKASSPLTILAVTVLTSLDPADLNAIGVERTPADQVLALSKMAWEAGIRGFVTSPAEVLTLRRALPEAVLVTPGVRPLGASQHDQKRIATPTRAILDGADLLVVGRPIKDAPDRRAAALAIGEEVRAALELRRASVPS